MDKFLVKTIALAIVTTASVHAFYDQKGGNRGQFVAFYDDKGNPADSAATLETDKSLENQVQSVLKSDKSFLGINAKVNAGIVTLTGSADNQAIKTKIESLIRGIKGVTKIENKITVKV